MNDINRCVTVVLGGQAGSEGKGKFAGYLALRGRFAAAVCNFMPNAGHTWVSKDGERIMVQQLPQAVVNPNLELFISAGSAIDADILHREIDSNWGSGNNLHIHPRAMVVKRHHRDEEAEVLNKISSTLKGCGAAAAQKIWRTNPKALAEHDPYLSQYVDKNFTEILHDMVRDDAAILVEAPQGFDLDINHGLEYPYCTSRQATTTQVLADAGLPAQSVEEVIAVIRPYPIRVGNVYSENGEMIGTSGSYLDSPEISWEIVAERAGAPREAITELTTVTGKLRRVFEMNWKRLREMCMTNGVTQIALNFANYIDWSVYEATSEDQLTEKVWEFIRKVEIETGVPVSLIGTGPRDHHIIDRRESMGII
jgi:adenylosuccinate synthase